MHCWGTHGEGRGWNHAWWIARYNNNNIIPYHLIYRTLWCAASPRKRCFGFNRRSNVVSVFPYYISRHIMALNIIKIIILNCDIKQTERHDGIITILCMCRLKRPKIKKKKTFRSDTLRCTIYYGIIIYINTLRRILCTNYTVSVFPNRSRHDIRNWRCAVPSPLEIKKIV